MMIRRKTFQIIFFSKDSRIRGASECECCRPAPLSLSGTNCNDALGCTMRAGIHPEHATNPYCDSKTTYFTLRWTGLIIFELHQFTLLWFSSFTSTPSFEYKRHSFATFQGLHRRRICLGNWRWDFSYILCWRSSSTIFRGEMFETPPPHGRFQCTRDIPPRMVVYDFDRYCHRYPWTVPLFSGWHVRTLGLWRKIMYFTHWKTWKTRTKLKCKCWDECHLSIWKSSEHPPIPLDR